MVEVAVRVVVVVEVEVEVVLKIRLAGNESRNLAKRAVDEAEEYSVVEIRKKTRSTEQNARMWSMLAEISKRIPWHGETLLPEEWKDVFTACLFRQRSVRGMEGGFVVLGLRTSKMTVAEMGDLMELMTAFAAERGITRWPWEPPEPGE